MDTSRAGRTPGRNYPALNQWEYAKRRAAFLEGDGSIHAHEGEIEVSAIAPVWPIDRVRPDPQGKRKNHRPRPKQLPRPVEPQPPTKGKPGKRDDDK